MLLLDELRRLSQSEPSPFRAQLLKEDAARLQRVKELARAEGDFAAFKPKALRLGWTQGDQRTHELVEPLTVLLERVYLCETAQASAATEHEIMEAWLEFHRVRMERLIGCLATPMPKPAGPG